MLHIANLGLIIEFTLKSPFFCFPQIYQINVDVKHLIISDLNQR
jgi:hypothetical protein